MRASAAIATLALLAAPACNDPCGAPERCAYATLLIFVHSAATGEPLRDATVSQGGTPLPTDFTSASCGNDLCTIAVSPAAGPVTISVPGYQDTVITFMPRQGTCGAPVRQAVDVGLRPADDPMPPTITGPADRGAGCN